MTKTTRTVMEQYQIRKTKKQKTAFIEYVQSAAAEQGLPCRVEKGVFGVRNIVVGDPEQAEVVFTAHYDTCAVMPFPNFATPKHFGIYLLYQVVIVLAIFAMLIGGVVLLYLAARALLTMLGVEVNEGVMGQIGFWLYDVVLLGLLWLMIAGPANKHTVNDNTSGVTVLLDLMTELPETERSKAAFVFFDLEEMGLFGSSAFASAHKKQMKQKLLINFDCVSDGEYMLFAVRKKARMMAPLLAECFTSDDTVQAEVLTKGVFYPSDQSNFPMGVGVAALKKSRRFGVLYLDRIHTKKDTVYREENITFLKKGAQALLRRL
ncbi:MAG: M28 family peptidase [Clostridia bacterium]|nr:M28 family peptidase [Clostridia bacterium]